MNILINLIPIKQGGGQQVASNFIYHLKQFKDIEFFFVVTEDTYIHNKLLRLEFLNITAIKRTLFHRAFFELYELDKIINKNKINIIYTLFGPGIFSRRCLSVTGCAYSNLFFPEIDFWKGLPLLKKVKMKFIDKYRLSRTLKSDAIIFENEAMRKRAISLFNYPEKRTKLILPSISEYPAKQLRDELAVKLYDINPDKFNILLLSGWARNKNIEILPEVLKELYLRRRFDIQFIISVNPSSAKSQSFLKRAKELKVDKNLKLIGTVLPTELPELFRKINAVLLMSKLESFSNNIIESWYFKKPLLISDKEWAREICKGAAIYIDRNNPIDIASKITELIDDPTISETLKLNSSLVLKDYPSAFGKVEKQLNYIKEILSLNL